MTRLRLVQLLCVASLVAVAACARLTGNEGSALSVGLTLERPMDPPPVLRALIGGRRIEVGPTSAGASAELRLRADGPVQVTVTLLTSSGEPLADAAFEHQIRRGHQHWISAKLARQRPVGFCMGEVVAAPLRGATADTLFVMYGSIPEGAIC